MGTIPIPSIDTVYTYKLGVTMNTDTKYREEKLKNANFFLEACLKELDQDKTINSVPDKISHSCPKPFWQRYCVTIKLC